jgi:hypothetical protein
MENKIQIKTVGFVDPRLLGSKKTLTPKANKGLAKIAANKELAEKEAKEAQALKTRIENLWK